MHLVPGRYVMTEMKQKQDISKGDISMLFDSFLKRFDLRTIF